MTERRFNAFSADSHPKGEVQLARSPGVCQDFSRPTNWI
jgi:hypothetical protein